MGGPNLSGRRSVSSKNCASLQLEDGLQRIGRVLGGIVGSMDAPEVDSMTESRYQHFPTLSQGYRRVFVGLRTSKLLSPTSRRKTYSGMSSLETGSTERCFVGSYQATSSLQRRHRTMMNTQPATDLSPTRSPLRNLTSHLHP